MNDFKNKKKECGLTLIESVIAAAISAIVVAGVVSLVANISKNQVEQNKKNDSRFVQDETLTVAQSVLFDVHSVESGKRTSGICKNIIVQNPRPGIGYVELSLDFSFFENSEVWTSKLPNNLKAIDCNKKINISSTYKKCFKFEKENKNYYTAIGLDAVNMSTRGWALSVLDNNKLQEDIKKIAFDFKSTVFNEKFNIVRADSLFVAASDVGYCDLEIKATQTPESTEKLYYKVYPSGSGLVDANSENIYNFTSFEKDKSHLLEFKLLKPNVQAGKVDGENLSVDSQYNVEISCNEKKFKCRGDSSNREFDDTLEIDMILYYNPGKSFPYDVNSDLEMSFSSSGGNIPVSNALLNTQIDEGNNLRLKKGSNNYSLSVSNMNNTCNAICNKNEKGTFYKGVFSFDLYTGNNKNKIFLKKDPEVFSSSGEVACTTCYMKSCARLGLGTFGPIQTTSYSNGHPVEPLDGNIPECSAKKEMSTKSFATVTEMTSVADKCLKGNLLSEKLNLTLDDCSKKLPIMCFSFGKFRLATDINTGKIIHDTKANSNKVCFEQGIEILSLSKVKDWLSMSEDNLSKYFNFYAGDKLKFINLSNQGIFLAPQTNEQLNDTIKDFKDKLLPLSENFWIGYELNDSGYSLSSLPMVYNTNNSPLVKESALFFSENSIVNIKKPKNTLDNFSINSGSNRVGVLLHNLRHKGVTFIDETQSISLPFVCYKKASGYFISSEKSTNYTDGVSICKKDGALFYPPLTPLQWTSSMLKLNENEYNKPFPDQDYKYNRAAWVAVESLTGGDTSYNKDIYNLHPELSKLPLEVSPKKTYTSVYELIKADKSVTELLKSLEE